MQTKFWKWKDSVSSEGSELLLEGVIAEETWWGDEVTPKAFRDELNSKSGDITVSLNSQGGDVFAGVSIYNSLKDYKGNVTVKVNGLAASIASVIAMAGDTIIMAPGSMMMVHSPWTFAAGNSDELKKTAGVLDSIEASLVPIYSSRTGMSEEEVIALLKAETWMTPQEAVEKGFADKAEESKSQGYSDAIKNVLAGKVSYSMEATAKSIESLKAKLLASEEEEPEVSQEKESEEKAGETQVKNEETEKKEEKTTETTKETEMEKEVQEVIAQTQVVAVAEQPKADSAPAVRNYLKTRESVEAFALILQEQAGKTSDEVKAAWKNHLEVKMGVTNPEIFLPDALISVIEDQFKAGGPIWNRVTKTGLDVFKAAWDTVTGEDSRAKGYNRSVEDEKAEEVITIAARILRPQFVYKYIVLNKEDIKEQRSTGALVTYVLSELPRRIIREIERAILIGDGRTPSTAYKIQTGNPRGFYPVKVDAAANNVFAKRYVPSAGESHYSAVVNAYDLLDSEGTPTLISKKGYITTMKLEQSANGGYIFPLGTNFAQVLEVDSIYQPDWMAEDTDNDAYLVILPNYKIVGDTSIEAFQNFVLKTNTEEYLQEVWTGGGLTVRGSAVAIAETPES